MQLHLAIYISNNVNKDSLIERIVNGSLIQSLSGLSGAVFSEGVLNKYIQKELRYDQFDITTKVGNTLNKSSEGERKQALLDYLLGLNPQYLIVDNVYGSLDTKAQVDIRERLINLKDRVSILQITNRKEDFLNFISDRYSYEQGQLIRLKKTIKEVTVNNRFKETIPLQKDLNSERHTSLIEFNKVTVSYGNRTIIKDIKWEVKPGEFWKLTGPNGSGKSTMLSMIYGDNPKAYGQDIKLFGVKKGSGESVWDIKKRIGYFSSDMVRGFSRLDSVGNMIVSGFHDSIGLYKKPSHGEIAIAQQWLKVLGMFDDRKKSYSALSKGQQRLVLITRAMVKQPPLLILDEPTNGLDDEDALLFSQLINKIASETNTAIIFVSHREEKGLDPQFIFELIPTDDGSIGNFQTLGISNDYTY